MTNDIPVKITLVFGYVKLRHWFELQPDGSLRGMCSRTDYDRDGRILAHKVSSTGATLSFDERPTDAGSFLA